MRKFLTRSVIVALSIFAAPRLHAGPRVDIVTGTDAPRLDRFAAQEMAGQLKQLFDAQVQIADKVPADSPNLILLGSPATNPAVKAAMGDRWPKLSDQGHLLKSVTWDGRKALVVGGGSPVATMWAAYELGYRFGIRYLLHGDVLPVNPGAMTSDNFDVVLEPALGIRSLLGLDPYVLGSEARGLAEHKRILGQLAKLKFNDLQLSLQCWQPFIHYEFQGVKKNKAQLFGDSPFPVDGDTAGRAAFGGAKEFTNPDLARKATYEAQTAAGIGLIRGVLNAARELGMSTAIAISPLDFPREYDPFLPGGDDRGRLSVRPRNKQRPGDPQLKGLASTQVRAYLTTYPEIDTLVFRLPDGLDWGDHHEAAWKRLDARTGIGKVLDLKRVLRTAPKRKNAGSTKELKSEIVALDFFTELIADSELLRRPQGGNVRLSLGNLDPVFFPVLDKLVPPQTGFTQLIVPLDLSDQSQGILPGLTTGHTHAAFNRMPKPGCAGFLAFPGLLGESDPQLHYLARNSFGSQLAPQAACDELFTPIWGPGVSDRLTKAFDMIERAHTLIDKEYTSNSDVPLVSVESHYAIEESPRAWWKELRSLYAGAMDEVLRASTRSDQLGRPTLYYYSKRLEFAYEHMNCIEAARLAGVARKKGDSDTQLEHLEKAVESLYNALNALSEVARDSSDRHVIAVMNKYAYRPLKKELEKLEKSAK